MRKYRSLLAWQRAHAPAVGVLEARDGARDRRGYPVFDQMRRAAVSVEANIVEGYALGTTPQFRRHLRIALASAAEVEVMTELAAKRGYLEQAIAARLVQLSQEVISLLMGLIP